MDGFWYILHVSPGLIITMEIPAPTVGPETSFSTGLVSTLTAPHALSFLRSIAGIDESIVSRFTPTVQSLSSTTSLLTFCLTNSRSLFSSSAIPLTEITSLLSAIIVIPLRCCTWEGTEISYYDVTAKRGKLGCTEDFGGVLYQTIFPHIEQQSKLGIVASCLS